MQRLENTADGNLWMIAYDRHSLYLYDIRENKLINVLKQYEQHFNTPLQIENLYPLSKGITWVTLFADVEEVLHCREILPAFDTIDIAGILPDGQAHIPRRNAFAHPQLGQTLRKPLFILNLIVHNLPPSF